MLAGGTGTRAMGRLIVCRYSIGLKRLKILTEISSRNCVYIAASKTIYSPGPDPGIGSQIALSKCKICGVYAQVVDTHNAKLSIIP